MYDILLLDGRCEADPGGWGGGGGSLVGRCSSVEINTNTLSARLSRPPEPGRGAFTSVTQRFRQKEALTGVPGGRRR